MTESARRTLLVAASAWALTACAGWGERSIASVAPSSDSIGPLTVDLHSHAGRVLVSRNPAIGTLRPFTPLAAPMRQGGMNLVCLAAVTDTLVTRVSSDRRKFEPYRSAEAGELQRLGEVEFARIAALVERDNLFVVKSRSDLALVAARGPSIIVACEGADFLEGSLQRLDDAHHDHGLRDLQLTHYRINELGDIQTETPVHGGLTPFGADVVRRCQRLGIVVDVAHGTFDLVRAVAEISTKPLVLSHTSLAAHPGPRSRQIGADHARLVAQTGGVIGVWPSAGAFATLDQMAEGAKRMADVIGVDHVGLGTDMLGFINTPVLNRYEQLPSYGEALARAGFSAPEVAQVLGGNAARVLAANLI